jgi:ElaB/YqjD/DUF883 family membrane-anchored ribosome-binding protein
MRLLTRSLLTVSAFALAGAIAWPQSLGEIAAREKERQQKVKKKTGGAAHVITEDDLRGRGAGTYSQPGTGTAGTPSASPSPGASPGAEKAKTDDEIRAEQEKAWRDRLQQAQEEVTRLSTGVEGLQRDLGDPSVGVYGPGRAKAVSRLEEAQKQLAAAKQRVEDLTEEGRRNRFR